MNYIEIEMNGQKVGLKFAYPQAKEFAIALADNADLYFEGENITTFGIAKLLQTAYKNNCLVKEMKPALTLESFTDFIDENSENQVVLDQLLDVLNVWQESKYTKLWVDAVKKNTTAILQKIQETKPKKNTRGSKQRSTPTGSAKES